MHEKVAQPAVTNAILKRHGFHMRKGVRAELFDRPADFAKNCSSS